MVAQEGRKIQQEKIEIKRRNEMSSDGELFITETLDSCVQEKFGLDLSFDYLEYADICDEGEIPDDGEVDVLDDEEKVIGKVTWKTTYSHERDVFGGFYTEADIDMKSLKLFLDGKEIKKKKKIKVS
jgi:hypothetical protein